MHAHKLGWNIDVSVCVHTKLAEILMHVHKISYNIDRKQITYKSVADGLFWQCSSMNSSMNALAWLVRVKNALGTLFFFTVVGLPLRIAASILWTRAFLGLLIPTARIQPLRQHFPSRGKWYWNFGFFFPSTTTAKFFILFCSHCLSPRLVPPAQQQAR